MDIFMIEFGRLACTSVLSVWREDGCVCPERGGGMALPRSYTAVDDGELNVGEGVKEKKKENKEEKEWIDDRSH